jgi:hypothetical protein
VCHKPITKGRFNVLKAVAGSVSLPSCYTLPLCYTSFGGVFLEQGCLFRDPVDILALMYSTDALQRHFPILH